MSSAGRDFLNQKPTQKEAGGPKIGSKRGGRLAVPSPGFMGRTTFPKGCFTLTPFSSKSPVALLFSRLFVPSSRRKNSTNSKENSGKKNPAWVSRRYPKTRCFPIFLIAFPSARTCRTYDSLLPLRRMKFAVSMIASRRYLPVHGLLIRSSCHALLVQHGLHERHDGPHAVFGLGEDERSVGVEDLFVFFFFVREVKKVAKGIKGG